MQIVIRHWGRAREVVVDHAPGATHRLGTREDLLHNPDEIIGHVRVDRLLAA